MQHTMLGQLAGVITQPFQLLAEARELSIAELTHLCHDATLARTIHHLARTYLGPTPYTRIQRKTQTHLRNSGATLHMLEAIEREARQVKGEHAKWRLRLDIARRAAEAAGAGGLAGAQTGGARVQSGGADAAGAQPGSTAEPGAQPGEQHQHTTRDMRIRNGKAIAATTNAILKHARNLRKQRQTQRSGPAFGYTTNRRTGTQASTISIHGRLEDINALRHACDALAEHHLNQQHAAQPAAVNTGRHASNQQHAAQPAAEHVRNSASTMRQSDVREQLRRGHVDIASLLLGALAGGGPAVPTANPPANGNAAPNHDTQAANSHAVTPTVAIHRTLRPVVVIPLSEATSVLDATANETTFQCSDGVVRSSSEVARQILGEDWYFMLLHPVDGPVDLLRGQRFASEKQRIMASAENVRCCWPGCNTPADDCQVHHLQAWRFGGETNMRNLATCCRFHNGWNDDDPNAPPAHGRLERVDGVVRHSFDGG